MPLRQPCPGLAGAALLMIIHLTLFHLMQSGAGCSEQQSAQSPLPGDPGQDFWGCGEVHPSIPSTYLLLNRASKRVGRWEAWTLRDAVSSTVGWDQPLESHREIWEVPKHLVGTEAEHWGSWALCSPCTCGHAHLTLHSLLSSPSPPGQL